jgi:hypothetical protein
LVAGEGWFECVPSTTGIFGFHSQYQEKLKIRK